MRTRLLWLGLLCLAFLLALGLLVVSAEELPPPPVQAQFLLLPLDTIRDSHVADDSSKHRFPVVPIWANFRVARPMLRQILSSDANGIPLSGGSYIDAAYTAFHFSDEAG